MTMEWLSRLVEFRPVVALHLAAALAALVLGSVLMLRRKGTGSHRLMGWTWVALMATVAVSSAFIRDGRMPNVAGFSPIHGLTVFVAVMLPMAVLRIRRGDVQGHRKGMRGLFFGGCVVAGAFTLMPGRFFGRLVWPPLQSLLA
jgi:uncharacterized membrane protein